MASRCRGAEHDAIHTAFQEKRGFPKVLGAIDGTHIKIAAPKRDPAGYINRKGYHSIQLQVVCDHQRRFIHCFSGYPGSVNDQRIFSNSEMKGICQNANYFPDDCHLIGDAAYMNQKHLLTPFKDNGHLTNWQKNYNYCHSSTRMTVENSIGLLKQRFRLLLDNMPNTRTDWIPLFIMASCVLHNICLKNNDDLELENRLVEEPANIQVAGNLDIPDILKREGDRKRMEITYLLPQQL